MGGLRAGLVESGRRGAASLPFISYFRLRLRAPFAFVYSTAISIDVQSFIRPDATQVQETRICQPSTLLFCSGSTALFSALRFSSAHFNTGHGPTVTLYGGEKLQPNNQLPNPLLGFFYCTTSIVCILCLAARFLATDTRFLSFFDFSKSLILFVARLSFSFLILTLNTFIR